MDRQRLTLDNPIFAGNLRYKHRSVAYTRRHLQPTTVTDILVARKPKPKPKHAGLVAATVHAPRPKAPVRVAQARVRPTKVSTSTVRRSRMRRRKVRTSFKHSVLYAMAVLIFVAGAFAALNGFRTNRQVAAQVGHLTKATTQASSPSATTTDSSAPAGSAPSTVKPSASAVTSYAVAPDLPKYFILPGYDTKARILPMGIDANGALKTPGNVHDVGWYNASSKPGLSGAMLLDAHVSSWTTEGVFYHLKDLKTGDTVQVQRGDGTTYTYRVVKTQTYDYQHVDMKAAVMPVNESKPGLNMITCGGKVIPGTNEFDQRIVVFTEQV